jgi:hypothetical protein
MVRILLSRYSSGSAADPAAADVDRDQIRDRMILSRIRRDFA